MYVHKMSFNINMTDVYWWGAAASLGVRCLTLSKLEEVFVVFCARHPHNPLSCEQKREQRASDAAAINVIEHGPKLSLSDMALYFTAGTRDFNDLGGGQPGAKMIRQWDSVAPLSPCQ